MLWVIRYFKGFLLIKIYGDSCERLLNIAAKNGIMLWNMHYKKNYITACVSIKDFRLLRKIIRKKSLKIHILSKHGLPFIMNGYVNRTGIFCGIAIYFLILLFMSGFIWRVEVTGNEKTDTKQIIDTCSKLGVFEGVYKNKIDTANLPLKLLMKTDGLAWCSMNIEGCLLTVNVSETVKDTAAVPSNLIADFDGVIMRIDVQEGNVCVKIGDTVKKGDLLVSGVLKNNSDYIFKKSVGNIYAETVRKYTLSDNLTKVKQVPAGISVNRFVISVFGADIPLYLGDEYRNNKSELKIMELKLFGVDVPIKLYKRNYLIYQKKKITEGEDKVLKGIEKKIMKNINNINAVNCELTNKNIERNGNLLTLTEEFTCVENIAKEEIILFNTVN